MKKILFLAMVAVIATSCASKQEKQTAKWLKENGETAKQAKEAKALGFDMKESLSLTDWNSTPIDTITDGDIVKDGELWFAENDATYNLKLATSRYQTLTEWASLDYMKSESEKLRKEAEEASREADKALAKVDSINNYLTTEAAQKPLYYVYECVLKVKSKNPLTGDKMNGEVKCYSYVSIKNGNVVKVVDDGKPYKMSGSKLERY